MFDLLEPNTVRLTEPQSVCKSQDNPFMDTKIKAVLAKNLGALMARSGKYPTNNKLSAATGLGLGTINRIRNQESAASIETVATIAQKFGLTASQMLDENLLGDGNCSTATSEPLPDWLLSLIEAATEANLRGSLPPATVKGLIALLNSLASPPTGQLVPDNRVAEANSLRSAGKPDTETE